MPLDSGFMIDPWVRHRVKVTYGLLNTLWWRLMPGVRFKVAWPSTSISSDPNDVYRQWLERNVGRQGWDWDWMLVDNDVADNLLTIKFRRGRHRYMAAALLKWG